jgi:hypothetical protein
VVPTIRIGRFLTRAEAEVARGMLETHGIDARVLGDDGAGVQPDISYGYGGVTLAIHPDDEADARDLLDDVDAPIDRAELRPRGWRPTGIVVVAGVLLLLLGVEFALEGSVLTYR